MFGSSFNDTISFGHKFGDGADPVMYRPMCGCLAEVKVTLALMC